MHMQKISMVKTYKHDGAEHQVQL